MSHNLGDSYIRHAKKIITLDSTTYRLEPLEELTGRPPRYLAYLTCGFRMETLLLEPWKSKNLTAPNTPLGVYIRLAVAHHSQRNIATVSQNQQERSKR